MSDKGYSDRDEHGLSARQLVLLFLGIVTVCGVFFAAGFLVGYNERTSKGVPQTEQVTASGDIPPTVNTPQKSDEKPVNPPVAESLPKSAPIEPTPAVSTPVRKAPEPQKKETARAATPPAASAETGRFVLQVAASSSKPDAESVAKALKSKGLPAFVVSPQAGGDKLYRVQIGPYPTREAAEAMKPRLEQEGFKQPFIKH